LLIIGNSQAEVAFDILTVRVLRRFEWIAIFFALSLALIIACTDALENVKVLRVAHNNVIAAGINGIA
jgi:hypothetical protein